MSLRDEAVLFTLLYAAYFFSYASRKNIVFIAPHLGDHGYSKSDLGASQSSFALCYLVSKLSANIVCNWASPRVMLSLGITTVGIINVLAGVLDNPGHLWFLWGLNGLCSGVCWPPIGVLIISNFPVSKRGKVWSLISTSMNAGATLSPLITDLLALYTSWNMSFTVIGLLDILLGVVLYLTLQAYSQQGAGAGEAREEHTPWKWDMLLNKFMFLICSGYFIITFALITMATWGQMLFMERLGVESLQAGLVVSGYEIGGFCGAVVSGFITDYISLNYQTTNPRSYSTAICSGIGCLSAITLQTLGTSMFVCRVCAFGYGFGMFGTVAMYGLMTREYVTREHGGFLTAFLGVMSQLGGFCAGSPLASYFEDKGVEEGFWIVSYVLPITFVLMCLLTAVDGRYKVKRD